MRINEDIMIPRGIIVEVYGDTGVGKSNLVLSWVKGVQDDNLCVFVDADYKLTVDQAKRQGLGDNIIILQSNVIEDIFDTVTQYVDNGADYVILDSTASVIPAVFNNKPIEQISYKDKSKAFKLGLQQLQPSLLRNDASLILVSHKRFTPDGVVYTTGGKITALYSALRLEISAGRDISVVKNRINPAVMLLEKEEISYEPVGTKQRLLP